jgi:nondiscriminating aspartyl-tRNA synthetase
MERVLSIDVAPRTGQVVRIAGWLHNQRQLAHVTFALIRDRTGITQVVIEDAALRARVSEMLPETVVEVEGLVVRTDQVPSGVEIHDPTIVVVSHPSELGPFELRRPTLDIQLPTLLDHAALAQRHPRQQAYARIAAASVAGFRSALDSRGFTEIHTPKIVGSATESGAEVFGVDYFGAPAFLAQSPQFFKQMMVGALERVYEVGPVFRAEPHNTARHLAQYTSLDVEFGFIESHFDVMALLSEVLREMRRTVLQRCTREIELIGVEVPEVPDEIPHVHFSDAQEMIEAQTGERVIGEPDLSPSNERWLGEWALREYGSEFVFVVGYPMAKRPFYTRPDRDRPEFSKSFDLLFRGLELVTGGQRLHLYEEYVDVLAGENLEPLEGYLSAFRHGMPPHGGFAIGLERWVARLVGAENVRLVTLFPRDLTRLSP